MAQESTTNPVYENLEPTYNWAQYQASKTLILKLPGFRRDQLKVQVMSNRKLKIRGERQMSENKWRRFSKEFSLDSDVQTNKIGARLVGDNLYVTLPKVNEPQGPTLPHQVPKPQQLSKAEAPPIQMPDQRKAPQEVPRPNSKEDKAKAEAKADEIAQKKKEQNDGKEKGKIEADANKVAQERKQGNMEADVNKEAQNNKSPNELDQEAKATAPTAKEKHETVGEWGQGEAKVDQRFVGDNLYVTLPEDYNPQGPTPPYQVPKPQQLPIAEAPPIQKPDQRKALQEVPCPKPKEDKAKADEIAQKKKEQNDGKEKGKIEADANKEAQNKKNPNELDEEEKATAPTAQEKHEIVGGWGQGEAKVDHRLPTGFLRLNSTAQQYKRALVGLIAVAKKQRKLTNLIVAILLVLVLGLCVKNATKSYSGRAKIQEL